jgi:Tol biopolymer transport system component
MTRGVPNGCFAESSETMDGVKSRSQLATLVLAATAAFAAAACGGGGAGEAKAPPKGRIVFARFDASLSGTVTNTMNPDGSDVQRLFARGQSEFPHWSPDGGQIAIFCCDDGMAAHLIDFDTGHFHELAPPDSTLETHCGYSWSPDGQRLSCESFGMTDRRRNGIYSIRSSDGGGLTRITSNPGGDDIPGDYSPDGKRLVFARSHHNAPLGIFVTKLDGGGLQQITPSGMHVTPEFGGVWSPKGNRILFVARAAPDHLRAIWVVNADGGGLHQLSIQPPCGGATSDPRSTDCFYPGWSLDGTKIVFTRVTGGTESNIHTVNTDGSGLFRVTKTGGGDQPDWGP